MLGDTNIRQELRWRGIHRREEAVSGALRTRRGSGHRQRCQAGYPEYPGNRNVSTSKTGCNGKEATCSPGYSQSISTPSSPYFLTKVTKFDAKVCRFAAELTALRKIVYVAGSVLMVQPAKESSIRKNDEGSWGILTTSKRSLYVGA